MMMAIAAIRPAMKAAAGQVVAAEEDIGRDHQCTSGIITRVATTIISGCASPACGRSGLRFKR